MMNSSVTRTALTRCVAASCLRHASRRKLIVGNSNSNKLYRFRNSSSSTTTPPPPPPPPPTHTAEGISLEVDQATHIKNFTMATALVAFCASVIWYSMNAVGQNSLDDDDDDQLAALRSEAAAARDEKAQQAATTNETNDMLSKFQSGEFDPDKYEDEEEEEEVGRGKKPWWKFW